MTRSKNSVSVVPGLTAKQKLVLERIQAVKKYVQAYDPEVAENPEKKSVYEAELQAARKAHEGQQPGRGPAMPKMDTDGDGKVSLAEFTEMHAQMFKRMDKDADGVITLAEMQAARPHRHAR